MTDQSEEIKKFELYCGEILRKGVAIESYLEMFISNHIAKDGFSVFLSYEVMTKLSFENKIKIFDKLLLEEQIEDEVRKSVVQAVRMVQRARNMVAHHDAMINNPKDAVIMQKKKSLTTPKDRVRITSSYVETIEQAILKFHEYMHQIYKILSDPKREKKIVFNV